MDDRTSLTTSKKVYSGICMTISLADRIEEWRGQLLDTSKRNRLISLNLGRNGAIKLVHPGGSALVPARGRGAGDELPL